MDKRKNKGIHVYGGSITSSKTGIYVRNDIDVTVRGLRFQNVDKPFDIETSGRVDISGTRIRDDRPRSTSQTSHRASSHGYNGGIGPALPARCPKCEAVFPSRRYGIRSPEFYGLNNRDICPCCGSEEATVANGLFDLAKETVGILQAESLTFEMLVTLQSAAADYLQGSATVDETAGKIAAVSTRLSTVFRKAFALGLPSSGAIALFFQLFPNALASWHAYFAQTDPANQRNYNIEQLCLEAFGETAKCKFIIQPVEEGHTRQVPTQTKNDHVPPTEKTDAEPADETNDSDHQIGLPETGPIPKPKPKRS